MHKVGVHHVCRDIGRLVSCESFSTNTETERTLSVKYLTTLSQQMLTAVKHVADDNFYRAMLCMRGICYGLCPSVRSSVRPSVTSRHSTKTAERRITQTTPHISFLTPKISAKFDRDHPIRGRQMQVEWVKIGDFRQIAGYTSKTVQDRRMVSIKVE